MLFTYQTKFQTEDIKQVNQIQELADTFTIPETDNGSYEEIRVISAVDQYLTFLVCDQYKKSVEDIENTEVGNTRRRKRSLQQAMKESFFNGANRFGNNYIA